MSVIVLPKWAKFNKVTRQWKLYQEFLPRTQLLTRQSLDDPTQEKVIALAPWDVQLWLVGDDCTFCDHVATNPTDDLTSIHVSLDALEGSIATPREFPPEATALLTDLTEARPLIRTEQVVKTLDGEHLVFGLVDCAATLDFVSKDFLIGFSFRKPSVQRLPDK
jgi:hypothetical protein